MGIVVAAFLSVVAVVLYAIRSGQVFDRLGISLTSTIVLYFAGGIAGGSLVGMLLPLTTWRSGSVAVGVLGALPVYLGASLLLGMKDMTSGIFVAIVVGGVVGYQAWTPDPDVG